MSKLKDEMITQEIEDSSKWVGEAEWRGVHSDYSDDEIEKMLYLEGNNDPDEPRIMRDE